MAVPPQKFRELILQLLFSQENSPDHHEMQKLMMQEIKVSKKTVINAQNIVQKVLEKLDMLDKLIKEVSYSFDITRIGRVEKNILRLAIYEMYFEDAIPEKVSIAEAIRLSRKFSTPESASFVNAVLDAIWKKKEGVPIDEQALDLYKKQVEEKEKIIHLRIKEIEQDRNRKDPS